MNPREIQFEKYWRDKISREISLYVLQNMDGMDADTLDWFEHLNGAMRKKYDSLD